MKKGCKIVGSVLFWCLVVAYFVCATLLRVHNEEKRIVERVEIVVKDADQRSFITPEKVLSMLQDEGVNPVGKSLDSVDLATINKTIEEYCFTAHSKTYIDYSGTLTIKVSQRCPLLRMRNSNGHDFYLTRDGYVLPVESHSTLNLPIITGDFDVPFGKSFRGRISEWLGEGEKKYRENYNFLSKLINFVVYLEESEWQEGECVQINLVRPAVKGSSEGYTEPHIELIPRRGNYLVELGKLEQEEDKIYRWRRFVESRVVDLQSGGVLNVEYDGQALWSTPTQKNKKNKK